MKGYIQVYTGDGKGKTTAALGLAVRAAGAGLKVFIAQFVKGMEYNELKTISKIKNVEIKQFGRKCFIYDQPTDKDINSAMKGWEEVKKITGAGNYDILILDELNIALQYKLIPLNEVLEFLKSKPENIEIIITGRNAPYEIIELADLVTDMKEEKHYFSKGIKARQGIEK